MAALAVWVAACGGSNQPPEAPDDDRLEEVDPDWDTGVGTGRAEDPDPETERNLSKKESKEHERPQFRDGMSVDEAIAAVPRHYDFIGIDQEALAKPLQDPETFKPCNAGSQHFTLRVAVWDGKAVGIDVDTKNEKLKECLVEQVKQIEWTDKEESINTVEYSF